jgi:hypothetical protein
MLGRLRLVAGRCGGELSPERSRTEGCEPGEAGDDAGAPDSGTAERGVANYP